MKKIKLLKLQFCIKCDRNIHSGGLCSDACHREFNRTLKYEGLSELPFCLHAPSCAEWLRHSYHLGHFLSEETEAAEPFQKAPEELAKTE